ncbi:MAG: hypothetical protein HYY65_13590 [Candidatus Tectomicrobia bacterium]|uniref:DUF2680 domain-containing protein n=1 Tax=Tectimicrobiota bacterium TaxID=2528274 RepID=A0A932M1H6_UNCTE|nr:hypothetical protein [Candidatus Tectomicrobia bacterium]
MRYILVTTLLTITMLAAPVLAQTTDQGTFDSLPPGEQKIADALFNAQVTNSTEGSPTPLTRDDIATMKQSGKGWGEIFQEMKSQGLVQEKNLGRVVSGSAREHRGASSATRTEAREGKSMTGALRTPESGSATGRSRDHFRGQVEENSRATFSSHGRSGWRASSGPGQWRKGFGNSFDTGGFGRSGHGAGHGRGGRK